MYLRHLEIGRFRNISNQELEFSQNHNLFFGDNAQGKTNLIEAIYILCLAKSFRAREDAELIPFGEQDFHLSGLFQDRGGLSRRVEVHYNPKQGKRIIVDGKPMIRFSELIGQFPVVVLSSEDHAITNGPPSQRRRFFNILFSQGSLRYLDHLKEYERILRQRNRLLNQMALGKSVPVNLLEAWSEQMILTGRELMRYRAQMIEEINGPLNDNYQAISHGDEALRVVYQPNVPFTKVEEIEEKFRSMLSDISAKERKRGTSLIGPHRDEFVFMIGKRDLRRFGSRGEHKSVLVSLKAAEALFLQKRTEIEPILLLDDLYAELDRDRGRYVLDLFQGGSQTFITGTSFDYAAIKELHGEVPAESVFFVQSGRITRH